MSKNLHDELVFAMPAIATRTLESFGDALLEQVSPEMLERPRPLDVLRLVDDVFPEYGIHVYPVDPAHLGDMEGATDPDGDEEIDIHLRADTWDQLLHGGRRAHRARATVMHEFSHAALHVPIIRRRRLTPNAPLLLARVSSSTLKPYQNPEWQAWTLAGCLLMPRAAIRKLRDRSPRNVGRVFEVSEDFARAHLQRLKIIVPNSKAPRGCYHAGPFSK